MIFNWKIQMMALMLSLTQLCLAQTDCNIQNHVFYSGEHITYEGAYNWGPIWLKAGWATFSTQKSKLDENEYFHIVGEGKTYKSYDWFFKVHDIYQSYVDTNTMLPYRFQRDVNEGGHRINNKYTFNHNENEVWVHYRKTNDRLKMEEETISIPNCTQDVLSAVLFVRNLDYDGLNKGDEIDFTIMIDAEVFDVSIVYHGIEKKKVRKNEKFHCHKITFDLIPGTIFAEKQTMTIWATADKNKLPVLVESPLSIGKAKFYLKSYEGLQYPLSSVIN